METNLDDYEKIFILYNERVFSDKKNNRRKIIGVFDNEKEAKIAFEHAKQTLKNLYDELVLFNNSIYKIEINNYDFDKCNTISFMVTFEMISHNEYICYSDCLFLNKKRRIFY